MELDCPHQLPVLLKALSSHDALLCTHEGWYGYGSDHWPSQGQGLERNHLNTGAWRTWEGAFGVELAWPLLAFPATFLALSCTFLLPSSF